MKSFKAIIHNKNLCIVLGSQLVFQLGIWFGTIGNLQFLQIHIKSHVLQAFFLVIGGVLGVIIGPYAGRYIDSTSKLKVLQLVGLMRIASVLSMLVAIYTGSIYWMVIYSIGIGCSASFFNPTIQTILPTLVKEDDLITVNAININIITLSRIFGAVLAGLLLTVAPLYTLFIIALIAYVILYFINFLLVIPNDIQLLPKKLKTNFKDIFPIIINNHPIKVVLTLSIIPLIFISGFNLFVIEIGKGQPSSIMGILYFIEGTSILIAGLLIKRVIKRYHKQVNILLFACCLMGIAQILLSLTNLYLTIFAFSVFGLAYGMFNPLLYTYAQQKVPSSIHGRFFSFKTMLDRTIMQLCLVLIGFLLDQIGYSSLMVLLGICTLTLVSAIIIDFRVNSKSYTTENKSNYSDV
ncbi:MULTISPECIES: MFS transporter [Bacillus]|uniref:Na+/melibiose symporter-like transporter n=2 Tax=Bacillus cereus group TaxID=86661 RepID=A0A4R4B222_BACTU|nr:MULTISPECIES: MFS transporter [Bacillus]MDR4943354.1 MFS transporter [Bacillus wiedmannii]MED2038574.1 MFS transporter [Bacillus wiedmannii]MED3315831.1 MFS transporter [Bacillus wiedmannii]OFC92619.1 macrolide-efflux protein [Bacillus wiedmannii]TCW47059.1 Na+/melibiose symporter-like transporter [Bacillus thuringiensis]